MSELIWKLIDCKTVRNIETLAETFRDIEDCTLEDGCEIKVSLRNGVDIYFEYDEHDNIVNYTVFI